MAARNTISDQTWDEQTELYELGHKHANQIARELGVSPQTVSRQMKRRGARKGSRVNESNQDLVSRLNHKARCAALRELSEAKRKLMVAEANMRAVGHMVAAVLEADQQGDIALAAPVIERMGAALGVARKRRSKAKHRK